MALKLARWRIRRLDIPLGRVFRWAGHSEERIDVLLLELETLSGLRGISEMAVRPKWHGETFRDVAVALQSACLPALQAVDLADEASFYKVLAKSTGSPLARALVDMACADILAQQAGLSLLELFARRLGNADGPHILHRAAFSCTITRAAPQVMAAEAAAAFDRFAVRAFKIKTGQGLETDTAVVSAIRNGAGAGAVLSADSNSAGPTEIVSDMALMLSDQGVVWFEDPCRLHADDRFGAVRAASTLPVLVDNACRSIGSARTFLELGAQGLSVKIMKTGLDESIAIARMAASYNARVTIGICASTSLSAIYSLSLFAALPAAWCAMPCEETFFFNLPQDVLAQPLPLADGDILLPPTGPLADMLDWKAIERMTIGS